MVESHTDVLLVEDQPDDADLLIHALRDFRPDMAVVVARDGLEALHHLLGDGEGRVTIPRLVVLDLRLPVLGGFEVLRSMRSDDRTARIPVIVLSGSCSPEDVGASRSYGAKACLRKPRTSREMRSVASSLVSALR